MTKILIAEDNLLIAMAMATSLEAAGHRVVGPAVANAPAMAAARETPPDLALVDIDLQGGDCGFELACRLRDELGVPSLFVTGQLGEAVARAEAACRSAGGSAGGSGERREAGDPGARIALVGALGKPFRLPVLLAAVDQALAYADGGDVPESGRQLKWFAAPISRPAGGSR